MANIDLRRVSVSAEALKLLPAAVARRLRCLPLNVEGEVLSVAVENAEDYRTLDQVQRLTGREVAALQVHDSGSLDRALRRYYDAAGSGNDGPALFRELLNRAAQMRASDIHVDPEGTGGHGRVHLRVDGRLREDRRLEPGACAELVSAVKVMAGMDIAERRVPQDGQIEAQSAGEHFSLRVATIPLVDGEKLTMRLLPSEEEQALTDLAGLGMSEEHHGLFLRALTVPHGIILLTGPTGSGKTTTLYAALRHLVEGGDRHALSIEDPVEISLPGVNQVRVRHAEGLTGFHKALRSALRHDPDIIMIGEIRDAESADIAVKAALTGHLVLSTLHTNDAPGVITRLVNMDVPPYLVASTLRLAVAQRLVRTPCSYCARRAEPDESTRTRLGLEAGEEVSVTNGCALCAGTGYAGRTGLFELLPMDDHLGELVLGGASEPELRRQAFERDGLPTLRQDGLAKVRSGTTTPEEVVRAVWTGA